MFGYGCGFSDFTICAVGRRLETCGSWRCSGFWHKALAASLSCGGQCGGDQSGKQLQVGASGKAVAVLLASCQEEVGQVREAGRGSFKEQKLY